MLGYSRSEFFDADLEKAVRSPRSHSSPTGIPPVTVCIAAFCRFGNNPIIVGASDRMLTAVDIEFEPEQPKIKPITTSIVVMTAGDSATQAEIIQGVEADTTAQIEANPQEWISVKSVADAYVKFYNGRKVREAQQDILVPLGLDLNTFISRQKEMDSNFISQLATELYGHRTPPVEAIVTGLDTTGAHIFVISNGKMVCNDMVGFASIGIGSNHANSQFMFAGHTKNKLYPETLLLTYSAKKRAEVAPGVGEATDMFFVGATLGSYTELDPFFTDKLEEIYQDIRKKTQASVEEGKGEISDFFQQIIEARDTEANKSEDQADTQEDSGESPADSKTVRAEAEAADPDAVPIADDAQSEQ